MTDHARLSVVPQYADNSSFSGGLAKSYVFDATSPAIPLLTQASAVVTGVTVDLGTFTTVSFLALKNGSATYPVLVRAAVVKASKTFAGGALTFTDGGAAADTIVEGGGGTLISALYALAGDQFYITGATTAGNNGTWNLQACTATTATLFAADTLAGGGADAGTPTIVCLGRANVLIPAGGVVVLQNVHPASDLVLTGVGGTAEVEVFAAGT